MDLGRHAGLSRDVPSRAEAGELRGITIGSLARLAEALDAELVVDIRWRGAELDQLIDRAHARLVVAAAKRLERAGWAVRVEVSFNHFGDRGRCDLVSWHPASRTLLIVEVKSRLGNLQETLGRLDVKVRLGHVICQQLGLPKPDRTVASLVMAEDGANRRVLRAHEPLFRSFGMRGRAALRWLHAPIASASGLVWFESPDAGESRAGRSQMPSRRRDVG